MKFLWCTLHVGAATLYSHVAHTLLECTRIAALLQARLLSNISQDRIALSPALRTAAPTQAFDPMSGEPRQCIEMESWPRVERMTETFGATVGRALLESFYATASTEGLSVIFNRCGFEGLSPNTLPLLPFRYIIGSV